MRRHSPSFNRESARRLIRRRLRLLRLRLWTEQLVQTAARGLCFGLALGLGGALALVMQSGLIDRAALLVAAALGLLGGLLIGLVRWPSLARTARVADHRFGLEARVATALEVLARSVPGRLDTAQVVDAAVTLRTARGGWPFPLLVAWREGLLALGLAGALVLALQFEGRGSSLLTGGPGPSLSPGDGDQSIAREVLPIPDGALPDRQAAGSQPSAAASESGALRALDELRRQREAGALTPEEVRAALERLEGQLSEQAADARGQREALESLARALSQVSASEAAADSIQRGDLQEAARELAQLGEESDQLSQEARDRLAQALRRSAAENAANPALAERERQAAEALARGDYERTREALEALGSEVARAGGQMPDQAELAAALERLQQERAAAGLPGLSGEVASAERQQDADASGQPDANQGGGSAPGQGEGSNQDSGLAQGEGAAPQPGSQAAAREGGDQRSAPLDLGATEPRLDVAGTEVDVPARPQPDAEAGDLTDRAGADEQVVSSTGAADETDRPSAPVQAGGPAERVIVPGDQRQVVRDYFARQSGKGTP